MVDTSFGGQAHSGSFSAGVLFSDGIGLPTGRAMASGDTSCLVTALGAWLGGRSSSPVGSLQLGGIVSGAFALPNIGAPTSGNSPQVGPVAAGPGFVNGGSARFQWNGPSAGPAYPGRGGGGTVNGPGGFSRAGTLGGIIRYVQAPVAPSMLSAVSSADGTSCTTSFGWGGDDGGSGISGYRLQRADNAAFTVNVATIDVSGGGNIITGLTPGKQYFWRATARNLCTDDAGQLGGPWSNAIGATQNQPALGRINTDGTNWSKLLDGKINIDGTAWVPLDMKINIDGTAWVDPGS